MKKQTLYPHVPKGKTEEVKPHGESVKVVILHEGVLEVEEHVPSM